MGACGQSEKGKGIEWMPKIEYVRLSDRVLAFLLARVRELALPQCRRGGSTKLGAWRLDRARR